MFFRTMETRLEDLHSDMVELRNLYSSPTSSLNLVLDGLLKKVKDLEAAKSTARSLSYRQVSNQTSVITSPSGELGRNDSTNYRKLTSQRMQAADPGSALLAGAMMQMGMPRGGTLHN